MMHGWDMGNGDWAWMTLSMVIGTAVVVLVVVMLLRATQGVGPTHQSDAPLDILAKRFAKGEIDEAEYQRRRNALQQ